MPYLIILIASCISLNSSISIYIISLSSKKMGAGSGTSRDNGLHGSPKSNLLLLRCFAYMHFITYKKQILFIQNFFLFQKSQKLHQYISFRVEYLIIIKNFDYRIHINGRTSWFEFATARYKGSVEGRAV